MTFGEVSKSCFQLLVVKVQISSASSDLDSTQFSGGLGIERFDVWSVFGWRAISRERSHHQNQTFRLLQIARSFRASSCQDLDRRTKD